jgi:hypothetical protein
MKAISAPQFAMPKVYRHFAVVTVAVTTLMAVFADGENRQAISSTVEERQHDQQLKRKEAEKFGQPVLKMEQDDSGGGRFASDSETGGGGGLANDGGGHSSRYGSVAEVVGPQMVPAGYRQHSLTDEQLAQLSPEEREALLDRMREARLGSSAQQRQQDLSRMMQASARRSGGDSDD